MCSYLIETFSYNLPTEVFTLEKGSSDKLVIRMEKSVANSQARQGHLYGGAAN